MALQTSGQISLNDIHLELGGSTTTQVSLNDSDVRALIGKASGAQNAFNEYYGAANEVDAVNEGNINGQANIQQATVSDYISSGGTLVIPSNFWVWSDSVSTPALIIDIPCTIKNSGYIVGKGGAGGDYSPTGSFTFSAGEDAGDAIKINSGVSNVTIINYSGAFIAGGGGGGGASVDNSDPADKGTAGGGGAGGGKGGDGIGGANSTNQYTGGSGGSINGYGSNAGYESNAVYVDFISAGYSGYGGGSGGGSGGYDSNVQRRAGGGGGRRLDSSVLGSYTNAHSTFPGKAAGAASDYYGCTGSHTGGFGGVGVGSVVGGMAAFGGSGGYEGQTAANAAGISGGGGGWGQAGGQNTKNNNNKKPGGAAGKAIEDTGNTYTLTNSGTIYGATT